MLHVRTSQLIIAGDACGIQGDFSWCMAMENIRCDIDENLWPDQHPEQQAWMSSKNYFFMGVIFVYLW